MIIKIQIKADRKNGCYRLNKVQKKLIVRHLDNAISQLLDYHPVTASLKVTRR